MKHVCLMRSFHDTIHVYIDILTYCSLHPCKPVVWDVPVYDLPIDQ